MARKKDKKNMLSLAKQLHKKLRSQPYLILTLIIFISLGGLYLVWDSKAATPSGVLFTPQEVEVWRNRAVNGPYKSDWDTVIRRKNDFLNNQNSGIVTNDDPTVTRDNLVSSGNIGKQIRPYLDSTAYRHSDLMNAAFYALVAEDENIADAVLARLVRQSQERYMQFKPDVWLTNSSALGNNASNVFAIGQYLSKHFNAYDYVKHYATSAEKEIIEGWISNATDYLHKVVYYERNRSWVNPDDGDYSDPTSTGVTTDRVYNGGPYSTRMAWRYNNRTAIMAVAAAQGAQMLNKQPVLENTENWVKEYVVTAVRKDMLDEFHRACNSQAFRGPKYANATLVSAIMIAEILARGGDSDAYDFTTSAGVAGTEGGTKNLKNAMLMMREHDLHNHVRYACTHTKTTENIIDFSMQKNLGQQAMYAIANNYYENPDIRKIYTTEYPSNVGGDWEPWDQGVWGNLPPTRFMYADTGVDPYVSTPSPESIPTDGTLIYELESTSPSTSSGDPNLIQSFSGASGGKFANFQADSTGDYVTYSVNVAAAGNYSVEVGTVDWQNRGQWQLSVNGSNLGNTQDGYAASNTATPRSLGEVNLSSGSNQFKFTVTGQNSSSSGLYMALDYIKLTPVESSEPEPEPQPSPEPEPTGARYEGESLTQTGSSGDQSTVQSFSGASGGQFVNYQADAADDHVSYTVNVETTGSYDVSVAMIGWQNRSKWQLSIDGSNLGSVQDAYATANTQHVSQLGNVELTTGSHTFRFSVAGKNSSSTGYYIATDYIELTPGSGSGGDSGTSGTTDINGDGVTNLLDFSILASNFGKTGSNLAGDINADGTVNLLDFSLLVKGL